MRAYRDSPFGVREREERAQRKTRKAQARQQAHQPKDEAIPEGYMEINQVASPNAYSNLDDIVVAPPRPGEIEPKERSPLLTPPPVPQERTLYPTEHLDDDINK